MKAANSGSNQLLPNVLLPYASQPVIITQGISRRST